MFKRAANYRSRNYDRICTLVQAWDTEGLKNLLKSPETCTETFATLSIHEKIDLFKHVTREEMLQYYPIWSDQLRDELPSLYMLKAMANIYGMNVSRVRLSDLEFPPQTDADIMRARKVNNEHKDALTLECVANLKQFGDNLLSRL